MGLFSKKRKLEVPLPPPDDLLKFPRPHQIEREIKLDEIEEAVGLEKVPSPVPEMPLPKRLSRSKEPFESSAFPTQFASAAITTKPFFIRVQPYQDLLKDLEKIRSGLSQLDLTSENLEKSEFNENKDYERLKSNLKRIHEELLLIDDLIFKK